MPKVNIAVPHELGQAEAIRRLRERFHTIQEQFGNQVSDLKTEWEDHGIQFGFRTFGLNIAGSVLSEASEVKVVAQLPLGAMMFKGTIEQRIRDELTKMLGS